MATIGQHISNLRGLILKYSRTQENYTNQFLYELLKGEINYELSATFKKFNHVSEWHWKRFCVELIKVKSHDCNCVPNNLDCLVLRSKYKIPKAIFGRNKSYLEFKTIGNEPVNLYDESEWLRVKDDDIKSMELAGSIINGYLYIWNNLKLKLIVVKGVWADVTEWADIPLCDEDGNNICFDPMTEDIPLDETVQNRIYEKILTLLKIPLQLPQDLTNDSNEQIKA